MHIFLGCLRRKAGVAVVIALVLALGSAGPSWAWLLETQLAGVRLGDHIINYLGHKDGHNSLWGIERYYGNPDGIVVASTGAAGAPGAAAPGAAGAPGAAPGGAPFFGGPPAAGGAPGAIPPPGAGGLATPPSAAEAFMPAAGSRAEFQAVPPTAGVIPEAGAPGAAGAAPGAAGPPSTTAGVQPTGAGGIPTWALPVWFELGLDRYGNPEVEYLYNRKMADRGEDLAIGIVVDSEGYITAVAVAGSPSDVARTAGGVPHRTVKLGDDFKRVLYRYGYPDRIETFNASGEERSVSFSDVTNVMESDMILYYDQETEDGKQKNIAFTLQGMIVRRIHIWVPFSE